MLKKLTLIFIIFFSFLNIGFAEETKNSTCDSSGCINSTNFSISTGNMGLGGNNLIKDTTTETINYTLGTIIEKLMIGLGSVSVLIMVIGAGYMIIYHGQDELLSKGKYIFISGVIALVVALSSYYMVSLLRYLLYKGN